MAFTFIGTSHIAKESIKEIRRVVEEKKPDIIAVELDKGRLMALLQKRKRRVALRDIKRIGVKGFIFALIGGIIQEKLGKYVGVKPGSEMLEAVQLAKRNNIELALIDQPIEVTLRKFSRSITWTEKFRIIGDIFTGIFFKKKRMKVLGLDEFDLHKVPTEKVIKKMMKEMKVRYPNIFRVLVSERNAIMARNLIKVQEKHPEKEIVVVVGAGHRKEMEKMVEK